MFQKVTKKVEPFIRIIKLMINNKIIYKTNNMNNYLKVGKYQTVVNRVLVLNNQAQKVVQ